MGSLICHVYGLTIDNLNEKYAEVLVVKIPLIFIMILMIKLVTGNREVAELSIKMNR